MQRWAFKNQVSSVLCSTLDSCYWRDLWVQLRTHQWIQKTSYICTGWIFYMLLRMLNEVFLKKHLNLTKICSHDLCASFGTMSMSPNWSIFRPAVIVWRPLGNRCYILLLKRMGYIGHIFMNVQGLTEALTIGQFLPKSYQKKRYLMGYKSLKDVFQKYLV